MKQYTSNDQTAKLIELGFEQPSSIASVEPIYGMGGRLDIDGTLYQSLKNNIEWMKKEYGGEYPINDDNVE